MTESTTSKDLTTAIVAALDKIVIEGGKEDYVYETPRDSEYTCAYLDGDEPSCLWGHVLIELGVEPDVIRKFEKASITKALANLFPSLDSAVISAAGRSQEAQDGVSPAFTEKRPWGVARLIFLDSIAAQK